MLSTQSARLRTGVWFETHPRHGPHGPRRQGRLQRRPDTKDPRHPGRQLDGGDFRLRSSCNNPTLDVILHVEEGTCDRHTGAPPDTHGTVAVARERKPDIAPLWAAGLLDTPDNTRGNPVARRDPGESWQRDSWAALGVRGSWMDQRVSRWLLGARPLAASTGWTAACARSERGKKPISLISPAGRALGSSPREKTFLSFSTLLGFFLGGLLWRSPSLRFGFKLRHLLGWRHFDA
jgi:hypothetical protein